MTFFTFDLKSINDSADFWYSTIGVNVFPANTQKKEIHENWS